MATFNINCSISFVTTAFQYLGHFLLPKPRTILDKTFGTLSHLHMMCTFSYNPPPPWTVLGVTCQTLLKNLVSVWASTLFRGRGGGGNPGIAKLTTVDWRSLTNFLPKRGGGKSSVPNPFGQDCSLYTDVVSFFFSFFSKTSASSPAKQARENFPHHYPLALAVNKSPPV